MPAHCISCLKPYICTLFFIQLLIKKGGGTVPCETLTTLPVNREKVPTHFFAFAKNR